ncbi:MAG TPA: hypothetical protein DIW48_12790 [Sphaerochaeta sp.]|nr:hypothetical protein [Sphaerochaeta sp.]
MGLSVSEISVANLESSRPWIYAFGGIPAIAENNREKWNSEYPVLSASSATDLMGGAPGELPSIERSKSAIASHIQSYPSMESV